MNSKKSVQFIAALGFLFAGQVATFSCAKRVSKDPLVTDANVQESGKKPKLDPTAALPKTPPVGAVPNAPSEAQSPPVAVTPLTEAPSVRVEITFANKILSQKVFYGSDLQYSSIHDKGMDVYLQSMAVGHIPATFRIAGSELQLVADHKRLFPSNINHPEQVISRFPILKRTTDTITVESSRAGTLLNEILTDKKTLAVRDSWVRSFEFDEKDNIILQETSVQLADGNIAEVMESIILQDSLKPGSDFVPIALKPSDPVGSSTPGDLPSRFMMLKTDKIRDGEKELSFAQHFDLSNAATIDWYITPNVPEKYLPAVKAGVEGWNRYFRLLKGIERNVLSFKGIMPESMKIGDPRFNIINWDSRLVAGAAYESQATDPFTGKQSHSLIYLPAAWVEIGKKYWANGQYSDSSAKPHNEPNDKLSEKSGSVSQKALADSKLNTNLIKIACLREIESAAGLLASGFATGANAKLTTEEFGIELLKGVLLHEVGHALGLGHNFKGSLSYEVAKKDSLFSTSIMDYNTYNLETAVFSTPESLDGPVLPYDRQALSALYNKAQNISAEEEKNPLPACNDEIADNEDGGVDPLCLRYDIEKDPTGSIQTALNRIEQDKIEGQVTLSDAMRNALSATLTVDALKGVETQEKALELVGKLSSQLLGAVRFAVLQDTSSLSRTVRTNLKTLSIHAKDSLPKEFKAPEMRERVFAGVQRAMGFLDLPDQTKKLVEQARNALSAGLKSSPWIQTVGGIPGDSEEEIQVSLDIALKAFDESLNDFKKDPTQGLVRLRVAVLGALGRKPAAPFFLGKTGPKEDQKLIDYETALIALLSDVAADKDKRLPQERLAAVTSLVTFKERKAAETTLRGLIDKVELERITADNNDARDLAESLIKLLKKEVKEEESKEKKS